MNAWQTVSLWETWHPRSPQPKLKVKNKTVCHAFIVACTCTVIEYPCNSTDHTPDKDQRLLNLMIMLKEQGIEIPAQRVVYVDDRDLHMDAIRGKSVTSKIECKSEISDLIGKTMNMESLKDCFL